MSNGNYVAVNPLWNGNEVGATTWGNGNGGTVGPVNAANSLVGGRASSITALTNGNYVVSSPGWGVGPASVNDGAVTWGNGNNGTFGLISADNSLIGGSQSTVTALSNGNYVVSSPRSSGGVAHGAVTWGDGDGGTVGLITATNSLVGGTYQDQIGYGGVGVIALGNGNYVVSSPYWHATNPPLENVGAVTFGNGNGGTVGLVSAANSLVGGRDRDGVGGRGSSTVNTGGLTTLSDSDYLVHSPDWDTYRSDTGAVSWGNGNNGTVGLVGSSNSVLGGEQGSGDYLDFDYDLKRKHLIVGRLSENIVTISGEGIFRDGFK